jgi:hypothetical protein
MKYVTVLQIAKHVRRNPQHVSRVLRRSGTPIERTAKDERGGIRILRKDADKLLAFRWPAAGPLPNPSVEEAAQ